MKSESHKELLSHIYIIILFHDKELANQIAWNGGSKDLPVEEKVLTGHYCFAGIPHLVVVISIENSSTFIYFFWGIILSYEVHDPTIAFSSF